MAIKLDMSKVYDRVEWVFIEQMVRKLGFFERWINLIIRRVSSISYSFMLNGSIYGLINPSRGLCQGDPLSPYMFLLCVEGFSSLVSQAVNSGEFLGFQCSRDGPTISHLFFVDDSLLFAQAMVSNCVSIRRILDAYARALGHIINFDKSAMCVSLSIPSQECDRLAAIIGFEVVDFHERYLGLPYFTRRKKKEIFDVITGRIWDKIRGWRDKFLSVGGKEVLIKAVIQSVPTYSMSLFQLPKCLLQETYRLSARFWWGSNCQSRKIHWCTWSRLCEAKEKGGLGFRDLEIFNKVVLANQCWCLMNNGNSLVARVLKVCYFPNDNFIDAEVKSTTSFI
ncbi:hypothetical protein Ddye_024153 [Dipteronia dyeriana]|uniref:Reverse transcriptase domain-containing protein n=1 Tax=Dipteronia dyeriana TaxID=168575 RepID=A0AAD9WU63_9ROSI|nr:hypothetical protein Ddye_024153 [Dipteronia dyeriana]